LKSLLRVQKGCSESKFFFDVASGLKKKYVIAFFIDTFGFFFAEAHTYLIVLNLCITEIY